MTMPWEYIAAFFYVCGFILAFCEQLDMFETRELPISILCSLFWPLISLAILYSTIFHRNLQ